MKKATLVKILCLAIVSLLLIPMVVACGEGTGDGTGTSSGNTEKVSVVFRLTNANASVVSGKTTVELDKGGKLTSSITPEVKLDGYTLKGWSFNQTGTDLWDGSERKVNEDLILFAVWEKITDDEGENNNTNTEGKVKIKFATRGGNIIDGEAEILIDKDTAITVAMTPEVERAGYTFKYWSYDRDGAEQWFDDETFSADTTLYAQWAEKGSSGNDNTDEGGNDNTDEGGNGEVKPPVDDNKITVEFDTGIGYMDDGIYEVEIDKGGRLSSLPTPLSEDPSYVFSGWYKESTFTNKVSISNKYDGDTVIYARWEKKTLCTDGTYNHNFDIWDVESLASCTKPATMVRVCLDCGEREIKEGDPAIGHNFGLWEDAFMAKQRRCTRLGCGELEIVQYKDVTLEVLGSKFAEQIEGNSDAFYNVPFTNLVNGKWDEGSGHFVGPKGVGAAYVIFNLIEPSKLDRIYFKGQGLTGINVLVQYEGDDDYTLVGVCSSADEKEKTPYVSPDPDKKIISIKFLEENPPNGTTMWQEVALVRVAEEE